VTSIFSSDELFDLSGFEHRDLFASGRPAWEALKVLEAWIREKIRPGVRGVVEPGAFVDKDVEVREGARVEAGAYVRGPTIIGEGTEVRHGAYVRGNVLTGKKCVIGHTTEAKTAIFLDDAKAAHFAYVGDSILGGHVNLGAGTKLANLKVVEGGVTVTGADGKSIATGLRKLGAILGDHVELGCNSVTAPGTVIGKRSIVYALASVRGTIPPDTIVSWKPALQMRPRRER
jgi:NDP-sugar pyrophosphorylase family protein